MNTLIRSINQGILFGLISFLVVATLWYAASMNFPTVSPPWSNIVSDGSFYTDYFSKILVNPDVATTDWTVKNSVKTEQIATTTNNILSKWNGSKLVDAVGLLNPSPGRIEVAGGIQIGNPGPNKILVNVWWGDMVWKPQSEVLRRCRTPLPSNLNPLHIISYPWSPSYWNQDYVKNAPNCGYTCRQGWTGSDCNIREELPTCGSSPNTCAFNGIAKNFSYGTCGGAQTWTCYNEDSYGWDVVCQIPRETCPVNWSCWGYQNTCTSGTPSWYSYGSCGGYSTWMCLGSNGWVNSSCTGPYNGDCPPVQTCGAFAGICWGNGAIDTYWCCWWGNPGGWVDQGGGCYHRCI